MDGLGCVPGRSHMTLKGQVCGTLENPGTDGHTTQASPFSLMRTCAITYKRSGGYWGHIFSPLHVGHQVVMVVVGNNY